MQASQVKIEYGDFQTPPELTEKICKKLWQIHVNPDVIIEPTCGIGNFLKAAALTFKETEKILGFLEIARPQPQFQHSCTCVCERFV